MQVTKEGKWKRTAILQLVCKNPDCGCEIDFLPEDGDALCKSDEGEYYVICLLCERAITVETALLGGKEKSTAGRPAAPTGVLFRSP